MTLNCIWLRPWFNFKLCSFKTSVSRLISLQRACSAESCPPPLNMEVKVWWTSSNMLRRPVDLNRDTVLKARWFSESVWLAVPELDELMSPSSSSRELPFSQAATSTLTDAMISTRRSLRRTGFWVSSAPSCPSVKKFSKH